MASVFIYHVVGDLTVGKPEMAEFYETETVEAAIGAIGESTKSGIPVWKKKMQVGIENAEMRQQRFVGILNCLDIVSFLAKWECLEDRQKAMKTPVSEVVVPNSSLLRQVDPGTRLIDALDMMKQGARRLLVPKSLAWKGMSKRFSVLYNGKWLKNNNGAAPDPTAHSNRLSASTTTSDHVQFCCLSREDVIRFIIGCLGALAPLPLSSISYLGAINPNFSAIEASVPAIEASHKLTGDPSVIAVVEQTPDGQRRIIGEISSSKLWKYDYSDAAWALANLSAGQFVMEVEDNTLSSPSLGFSVNRGGLSFGVSNSMYRGRTAPLTCKPTSSLAAVMAQMLSHRASNVWVTEEDEGDDVLVGVVGYADILAAVTKQRAAMNPANRSLEAFASEIQS